MILLNGASSSGKSTLAKALQRALDEPFLHVSSDQFVAAGMLPDRGDGLGPFAWWTQMRPRFFAGFHRCLPALADTGNDLIVEHVIEFPAWRDELSRLLAQPNPTTSPVPGTTGVVGRLHRSMRGRRLIRAVRDLVGGSLSTVDKRH